MRFAINTPNFGHYSDPRLMMEMAREAEDAGWDGFFIWDHMLWTWPENYPVADPYVLLAAMAAATTTIKLSPLVTPIARRRPWKLAREVTTLDHLSQGRFILGVGIGGDWFGDYLEIGELPDDKAHGEMLDEGLDVLAGLWSGELFAYEGQHYQIKDTQFLPKPVQQPRVPVWVAGMWPNKKPFRRAVPLDGIVPLRTDDQTLTPDDHRSIGAYILEHRTSGGPFDHVHAGWMERKDAGRDAEIVAEYSDAGVTWWSDGVGPEEPLEQARERIPPRTPQTLGGNMHGALTLDREQGSLFARMALAGIQREYPNKLDHVINGPDDLKSPRALHPAFYGCFDWHSAVHSHWMLIHLLRELPDLAEASEIRTALNENLSKENLLVETEYLSQPNRRSFERMYGWTWLLMLADELYTWDNPDGQRWSCYLQPLADVFVQRYLDFLPRQTYPIRTGTHPNTAFGLVFALDYAKTIGHNELESLIVQRSLDYFSSDTDCSAANEPSGADFLSPCLIEADLMRRVLPQEEFGPWLTRFLPGLSKGKPQNLFTPATVADRTDPQIVHLDGLNLSRAWCMRNIASVLSKVEPVYGVLAGAATRHAEAALPHIASGDYMGEHWLASFAVLMHTAPKPLSA